MTTDKIKKLADAKVAPKDAPKDPIEELDKTKPPIDKDRAARFVWQPGDIEITPPKGKPSSTKAPPKKT